MKFFVVIAALASIASAGPIVIIPSAPTTLLRSPLDSAIVQSERLGGNFAYTIAEGPQFQSIAPISVSFDERRMHSFYIEIVQFYFSCRHCVHQLVYRMH